MITDYLCQASSRYLSKNVAVEEHPQNDPLLSLVPLELSRGDIGGVCGVGVVHHVDNRHTQIDSHGISIDEAKKTFNWLQLKTKILILDLSENNYLEIQKDVCNQRHHQRFY